MEPENYCQECGKSLKSTKIVWLDMNVSTHEFREEPWPEEESQGMFPFGVQCAKKVLKNGGQMIRALGWEKYL